MDLPELSGTCRLLSNALVLVDDAIVVCRQALHLDLRARQRRILRGEIQALERRRSEIAECVGTVAYRFREIPIPPPGEAQAIAALTEEVEALMEQAESAERALDVAARTLRVADRLLGLLHHAAPEPGAMPETGIAGLAAGIGAGLVPALTDESVSTVTTGTPGPAPTVRQWQRAACSASAWRSEQ